MYGFRMRAKSKGLELLLRPYEPGEESNMLPGMQSWQVAQYLGLQAAQTLQTESEFITKLTGDPELLGWAICIVEGATSRPIGTSTLRLGWNSHSYIATSGIVIYDRAWWGRGVASLAHLARTHYAVNVRDLAAIRSGVAQDNVGSRRALESVGYARTGTVYHAGAIDGKICHSDDLLFVNPNKRSWDFFWGDSEVPEVFLEARKRARRALRRADNQIEYL